MASHVTQLVGVIFQLKSVPVLRAGYDQGGAAETGERLMKEVEEQVAAAEKLERCRRANDVHDFYNDTGWFILLCDETRLPEIPVDNIEDASSTVDDGPPVSITFTQPGTLGIKFCDVRGRCQVMGITAGTQAETHPQLGAGMVLTSVSGQSVRGLGYVQTLQAVKLGLRPLTLKFSGQLANAGEVMMRAVPPPPALMPLPPPTAPPRMPPPSSPLAQPHSADTGTKRAKTWLVSQYGCDEPTANSVLDAMQGAGCPEDSWVQELEAMHGDGSITSLLQAAEKPPPPPDTAAVMQQRPPSEPPPPEQPGQPPPSSSVLPVQQSVATDPDGVEALPGEDDVRCRHNPSPCCCAVCCQ